MPTRSKFTQDVRDRCLEGARVGAPAALCADIAGIDKATLHRWLERGKEADEDSPYRKFFQDFTEAKAHPKIRALGLAYKAMGDNPQLTWKYIERQVEGFAPPMPNMNSAPQVPVVINLALSDGQPALPSTVIEVGNEQNLESGAATSTPA